MARQNRAENNSETLGKRVWLAEAKLSIGWFVRVWKGLEGQRDEVGNRWTDQDWPFSVAAMEGIDGRLFPHDITPPAFRSTIFYFLVGLHWWPVKTCKVSPTEMRPATLFIPFPFVFAPSLAALPSFHRPILQNVLLNRVCRNFRDQTSRRETVVPRGAQPSLA